MEKIKQKLEEKLFDRKNIEDRIHSDIRNGEEVYKKDLDAIFVLSVVITTLEDLLKQILKNNNKNGNIILRGRAVVARRAHNPEVIGSNPIPATKLFLGVQEVRFDVDPE